MKAILGHKVGMTQVWDDKGRLIAATVIQAEPNTVIDKTRSLVGLATTGKTNKPQAKIADQLKSKKGIWLKEIKDLEEVDGQLTVSLFNKGDVVTVTGVTKGKGFAGVVKRHGFAGWPASHGHSHQRRPGSIGAQRPQRVVKGQKMAGHMGAEQLTVRGLKVVDVKPADNLLIIKGAIPGPARARVIIKEQDAAK